MASSTLADVLVVEPRAGDHRDEVGVELQRVEQPREEALALGAGEARRHLQAGRLDASEVGLGLLGENAGVDGPLVYLDDLDLRHAVLLEIPRSEPIIRAGMRIRHGNGRHLRGLSASAPIRAGFRD
jgi:hypothetical protein